MRDLLESKLEKKTVWIVQPQAEISRVEFEETENKIMSKNNTTTNLPLQRNTNS